MTPHAPQNNGWMDSDPKGMWFHADEVEALESGYAKLEAENATATHQIESLANQCQFQAERLVALDAENAELRKQCAAFHAEANDHYRASLAAATTLDRVRKVGIDPNYHGDPIDWEQKDQISTLRAIAAILYPTPENDNGMD